MIQISIKDLLIKSNPRYHVGKDAIQTTFYEKSKKFKIRSGQMKIYVTADNESHAIKKALIYATKKKYKLGLLLEVNNKYYYNTMTLLDGL
jgi:hypothetical protein